MIQASSGNAVFSKCGTYRYRLDRKWMFGSGRVVWVLLNPSTADAKKNDPTIRRCIRFSFDWGYQKLTILNLFAYRSTDPKAIRQQDDPIGPSNHRISREALMTADLVVCGWGNDGFYRKQDRRFLDLIQKCGKTPMILQWNASCKAPRHPLYIPAAANPILYPVEIL